MGQHERRPSGAILGTGLHGGGGDQLHSRVWLHPWLDLGDRFVLGARIFFRTGESTLDPEDRMALMGLADALRLILKGGTRGPTGLPRLRRHPAFISIQLSAFPLSRA